MCKCKKDNNTGTDNTGENNSGNRNSGYRNSGNRNSGDWNSGDCNSGDCNSGYCNSGNWNSGVFNPCEPLATFFGKPTTIKMSQFVGSAAWPDFYELTPCVWVESSIMTAEEKKAYPTNETTGGYIKTLTYKEAWAVFWRKTSEENKKKILALPNFDAAIFKEITGLDIEENSEVKRKAQELEDEATKMLAKAKELRQSL